MGPSKCGACSRTKRTKNTFAPGATALLPRAPATLCACRATPPTCAVTGTEVAGSVDADVDYSTNQRTKDPTSTGTECHGANDRQCGKATQASSETGGWGCIAVVLFSHDRKNEACEQGLTNRR